MANRLDRARAASTAVVLRAAAERVARRIEALRLTAKLLSVPSYEAGIEQVVARRADVFFAERAILLDAAARNQSPGDLQVLDRYFTHEPLALALARNNDDFRLIVDATLGHLYTSEEFPGLYAKWFGPLDEQTRAFFAATALPD